MASVSVLVIEHADSCPPGLVGEWLEAAGVRLDRVRCHRGDPLPADPTGHDGVVVLGGDMGATDDARHAWLTPTKALLREAVEAGVPTLGICLGHQLLAVACGGTIATLPEQQVGLQPVARTAAGRDDVLFGDLPDDTRAVHWNRDVVSSPPPGAVALADTRAGLQALRLGDRAWGVQFHPEVRAADLATWAANDLAAGRMDPVQVDRDLAAIEAAESDLAATLGPLTRRFAALLG